MIDHKAERSRLQMLLADTVTLLCKSGLHYTRRLQIQGLLGVTVDDEEVFIVHFNESFGQEESSSSSLSQSIDYKPSDSNKISSPRRINPSEKSCNGQDKSRNRPTATKLRNNVKESVVERSMSIDTACIEIQAVSKAASVEPTNQRQPDESNHNVGSEVDTSLLPLVIVTNEERVERDTSVCVEAERNHCTVADLKRHIKCEPVDNGVSCGDDNLDDNIDDVDDISEANNVIDMMVSNLVSNNSTDNDTDRSMAYHDTSSDAGEVSCYMSEYYAGDSMSQDDGLIPVVPSLHNWSVQKMGAKGLRVKLQSHCKRNSLVKSEETAVVSETLGEGEFHYCCVDGCNKKFLHRRHLLRHQTFKHGRVPTRRKGLTLHPRKSISLSSDAVTPAEFLDSLANSSAALVETCSTSADVGFDGESVIGSPS